MIWVVNANSVLCRIYAYQKNPAQIALLKEIDHPELRMKESDLLTNDKPGRYIARDSARGAYSPHMSPKEVAIDDFAREIAREINQGRNELLFLQLIIIASSHMSGLLFSHLDKNVKNLVINHIQKELIHLSEKELLAFLKEHAKYPETKA